MDKKPQDIPKPEFLPEPFEWIHILQGQTTLIYAPPDQTPERTVFVDDFFIAKYPITNEQYKVYVAETGRTPEISHLWNDEKFNQPLQPVIDLRWQEAMLFAKWFSAKIDYEVTLPSLAQWQRAAQGDDDRKYPWGNEWDEKKCNAFESLHHTTSVTQYPQGSSPFGVMDMAGNVCEWCITSYETGKDDIDFEIAETKLMPEELVWNEYRIFQGSSYHTHFRSAEIQRFGACSLWFPYMTGIRLVVNNHAKK